MARSLNASEVEEDFEWAALASAQFDEDLDDLDCKSVVTIVDAAAHDLGRLLSARVLSAKSELAQKAQRRQGQMQAQAAAEYTRLKAIIEGEIEAREAVQARLEKAMAVQHRLADALSSAREQGAARLAAFAVMNEWQRSLSAKKREAYCERLAGPHYLKTLLRRVYGGWRSTARMLRRARIDAFWERSVLELRAALQAHYEPKMKALQLEAAESRADAAAAWRAKDKLGDQLKAAFMRGVCQLNLETASILGPMGPAGPDGDGSSPADGSAALDELEPAPRPQTLPRPTRAEDVLAAARRGLEQVAQHRPSSTKERI